MGPFLHSDAASSGVGRWAVYGPTWSHPVAGVAVRREHAGDLAETCRAVQLVLPEDAVFTHLTAALLRGWPTPALTAPPLIACTDGDAPHLDRRGVYVRRCEIPPAHRLTLRGIAIASPAWTIVELAEHLSLIDLVVVIDHALHQRQTTLDAIRATMVKGRRGVRVLRRAMTLADARSESPWESILRLVHVLSGIAVIPQHRVLNAAGMVVARGDLGIAGTNRLAEYDGADHRDREQHRRDLRREKILARLSFERYGYTAVEILEHPADVIADACDALGVAFDERRIRPWLEEVAKCSLSASGRRALTQWLRRFDRSQVPRKRRPNADG